MLYEALPNSNDKGEGEACAQLKKTTKKNKNEYQERSSREVKRHHATAHVEGEKKHVWEILKRLRESTPRQLRKGRKRQGNSIEVVRQDATARMGASWGGIQNNNACTDRNEASDSTQDQR